ncbi:AAA domain [Xanthomonas bromi]|uniref:AAA domain n=1 Tax=Xanthomonas bromi TaxID=56449 RepID=A0A1C3NJU6_9XANT|nr:AAA family ATPase [Xanthomonas bromi]PPV05866.1 AAA family ATPase [Xanthomonas bromi]SBV50683.1 AAA domain [Xanthomonas bromi]
MKLQDLGPRLCILGPSNSGKSTLAQAVARKRGCSCVHLDRLHHLPNTAWRPRPRQDFFALHDAAIAEQQWVMDGNYLGCLSQRLARATGIVLLGIPVTTSLVRYLRRTWFEQHRCGGLDGAKEQVRWEMLRHIAVTERRKRTDLASLLERSSLPKIALLTVPAIDRFYRLEHPNPQGLRE